jgi:malonyl-CoA/methylmalonyl-CoA synthetase
MNNDNLYAVLRAGFPADLSATAVETCPIEEVGAEPLYYSWADLERASARIANLLASLELPEGSRVAVHVDKSVECLLLYLGVLRAGYVYLPLNSAYQATELEYFIANAEPGVVVCAPKNFPWLSKLAFQRGVKNVFTLGTQRDGSLLERAAFMSDVHEPVRRRSADLAAILYTSGTTGRSKGAMLTHGNLSSNALTLKDYWGWVRNDVLIHALPVFHVHGLFVAIHGALLNGSKMLWFEKFDPKATIRAMTRATVMMGVPTLYVRMLTEPALTREAVSTMRVFIAGSAPLLPETFEAWRERTGRAIVERYGMSETVMLTSNPYHEHRDGDGERRAGTVGRALPGVQLRIHDDKGQPCRSGDIGLIEVKGPNVFTGYWRMPEKTAGDVGLLDERGVVTIVGRSKDLIISGGYNVYPAEIEGYLNEQPGVAESAVVGVPHPDFGEGVIAVAVPKPGAVLDEAALIAAMKGRIAAFKVPKRVFVESELPRNQMGKVQKNLLRQRHETLFGGRG